MCKSRFLLLTFSFIIPFFCISQANITIVKPTQEEFLFNSSIEFIWNTSIYETNNTTYSIEISRDSSFNILQNSQSGILQTSAILNINSPGRYFWRISLLDGPNIISQSEISSFTYSNIRNLPGLSLMLMADVGVELDANNKVSKWTNLIDTSNSAVQSLTASRPILATNTSGVKSTPAIRLDGVDDMLEINSPFSIADYFVVANWGGTQTLFPSYNGLISGKSNYFLLIGNPPQGSRFLLNSPSLFINNKATNNFAPLQKSKLIFFKSNSSAMAPNMLIGRDRTFTNRYWNGDVSEIIISTQPLSDSLRDIVNKYLCQKYSNTLSLGSDIEVNSGFCDTLLQVDPNFTSYRWSNGDTTSSSLLSPGNTYQLTVTNNFGCSYTDEIYVTTPLKSELDVDLCLNQTFIWDTELPKSDFTFLWSDNTTDSLLTITQPGDYSVRVMDANSCFLDSDTITITFDSTLAAISLGPDTSVCLGNDIGLISTPSGVTSYLWNTNQTATRIIPQSTGYYWLDVTAGECTVRDSIFITIQGDAPTADFITPNICFGDSAFFTDNSQNPTLGIIDTWRWDFGNGLVDTSQNTSTFYTAPQLYNISLYVETDANCADSITKTVTINPNPSAGFMNSIACKGDSTFFTDTSSISSGSIQHWRWKFNDPNQNPDTSGLQNPAAVFNLAQNYPIQLIITSDLGCEDSVTQNLRVNDLPVPNFTVSGSCLGDSTRFVNSTVFQLGTTLKTTTWQFGNNTTSNIVSPTTFYSTPNLYSVTLETEASDGCRASISQQFEMNDKPVADFKTSVFYINSPGKATDLSTVTGTSINSWKYNLNQLGGYKDSSIIQNPRFTLSSLNDFELTQIVTSLKGCKDTSSKIINVRNNSVALFNSIDNITITKPSQGKIIFDSIVEFSWNKSKHETSSTSYSIVVSKDSSFSGGNIIQTGITLTNSSVNILTTGKYYWKVDLMLGTTIIDQSKTHSFSYSDINSLTGLSLILRADSGVILDSNNKVEKWLNLVDTSNSAVQSVASNRPTLVVSSNNINPTDAIKFDGIDDMLEINSPFFMGDYFVVANWGGAQSSFPSYNGLLSGKSNYFLVIGDPTQGTRFLLNSPSFFINSKATNNFAPLQKSKLLFFKSTIAASRPDMLIGRDRSFTNRYWNGDISEIITSAAPLNDSLRNVVNKYLCQKYSNTLSLGADINVAYGFCDTLVQVDTNFVKYSWSHGDTTSSTLLTPGNLYQLTVTNKLGCSYTDEIYVTAPVKPKNGATLCLGDSITWNTELSNADYNFLWSNLSTDSALTINQPGDYFVRITDTNYCYIDLDTITVSYDSTLATISLGPDTSICLGNDIGLLNTPSGVTSYLWNTNQTAARIVPQATGYYWVDVTAGECTERDSIFITIQGDAPTADFIAPNICFGDTAFFTDNSQNPTLGTIDTWRWSFGNGLTDTVQNTSTFYSAPQLYTISLYVETDAECADSTTKQLLVNPKPVAGFTNSLACVGDTVFFTDTSSVTSGGISTYNWKFNDPTQSVDTSASRQPSFTFNTAQNYPIRLIVTSGLGCKDTTFKNLRINGIPVPDYTVSGNCLTDSTSFINQTQLPPGDQLASINWKFGNNTNSNIPNPTIYYTISKFYLIQMDAVTDKGCSASITRQFEMNDKPVANFSTTDFCLNNKGLVTDLSTVRRTTLNQWDYQLRQAAYEDSSKLQNPVFTLNQLGDFNLTQIVTSLKGCKDTTFQNIPVRENPDAFFNLETYLGATPFGIKFDSVTASNEYSWSFGNGDSAFVFKPQYIYQDTGKFNISLLLKNQFGCIDSMKREVTVNSPNLDLFLDTVIVDQTNNLVRVGVVLINTGNNEINSVRMLANLNSSYRLEETWRGQLFPNDFIYTEFTSSVSLVGSQLNDFTCVEILAVNGIEDLDLIKEEICVKGTSDRLFLKAFPNPTTSNLSVEMVVPNRGELVARIYDNMGKEQAFLFEETREKGFYRFSVPSATFMNGMYYLIIDYKGARYNVPFIKK